MSAADHLKNIRERVEAATKGPWTWTKEQDGWGDCGPNLDGATDEVIGSWGHDANGIFVDPADAEFIAHARTDLPRLLAAVTNVLELHKPMGATDEVFCSACFDPDWTSPDDNNYPCPTVRTITTALGDEK